MELYAITQEVTGPRGHGEPGMPYLALATYDEGYTLGAPLPLFTSEEQAEEARSRMRYGDLYKVTPLQVKRRGL